MGYFRDSLLQLPLRDALHRSHEALREQKPTFEILYLPDLGGRPSTAPGRSLEVPKVSQSKIHGCRARKAALCERDSSDPIDVSHRGLLAMVRVSNRIVISCFLRST